MLWHFRYFNIYIDVYILNMDIEYVYYCLASNGYIFIEFTCTTFEQIFEQKTKRSPGHVRSQCTLACMKILLVSSPCLTYRWINSSKLLLELRLSIRIYFIPSYIQSVQSNNASKNNHDNKFIHIVVILFKPLAKTLFTCFSIDLLFFI